MKWYMAYFAVAKKMGEKLFNELLLNAYHPPLMQRLRQLQQRYVL